MTPGFYNNNLGRYYPFKVRAGVRLPHDAIADFGCTMLGGSGYVDGTHSVQLRWIRLVGTTLEFIFICDAPGLVSKHLIFQRSTTDPKYKLQFTREQPALSNAQIVDPLTPSHPAPIDDPEVCGDDPIWEGFLVTGDLTNLATYLTDNWPITGMFLYDPPSDLDTVEPSRTQYLGDQQIRVIGIANKERTRATTAENCRELCWPFVQQDIYVVTSCIYGDVRFEDGYNLNVTQDSVANSLTFDAFVGAGTGEPYTEVPVFGGENPPIGTSTLSGSLLCCEVIRSINGVGGKFFQIKEGPGVRVIDVPTQHRIIIDVDLHNMALCPALPEPEPIDCIYPSENPCECGPADMNDFVCPEGSNQTSTTTTTTSTTTTPAP